MDNVDVARLFEEVADLGVLLEINAQPDRLDLNDVHVRMAREAGARFVISTDAHRVAELDNMRYGVDQARRGWCTRQDVANTRSLDGLRKLLEKRPMLSPAVRSAEPAAPRRRLPLGVRERPRGVRRRAVAASCKGSAARGRESGGCNGRPQSHQRASRDPCLHG